MNNTTIENTTTWDQYVAKFDEILKQENPSAPYDDPAFLDYTKLNKSRINRWLKTGKLNPALVEIVKGITQKQTWYLILEPWCGDAAHSAPFIHLIAELNPKITLRIVWRDTAPFMIDDYLTNGGKSIPKLIIRDENEQDLHVWGPRTEECQALYIQLKEAGKDMENIKIELQNWYNNDKGVSLQAAFIELLK